MMTSRLRASAAHRWVNCPASVNHKDSGSHGRMAEKGTFAHEVAAHIMMERMTPAEAGQYFDEIGDDYVDSRYGFTFKEIRETVMKYVNYCYRIEEGATTWVEMDVTKFLKDGVHKDLGGTADFVALSEDRLEVVDLKTGYNEVPVKDNLQLIIYLLGARFYYIDSANRADWIRPTPSTFRATIIQPNSVHGTVEHSHDYTLEELKEWEKTIKAAADTAGQPIYRAGAHCDYCPHAAYCKELHGSVGKLVTRANMGATEVRERRKEIGELAAQLPMIKAMVRMVEKEMDKLMVEHQEDIPGFKLVKKRNSRKFRNQSVARAVLESSGVDLTEFEVEITPAKVEKLMGRHEALKVFDEYDLVEVVEGSLTWAPESDKRKKVAQISIDDFED